MYYIHKRRHCIEISIMQISNRMFSQILPWKTKHKNETYTFYVSTYYFCRFVSITQIWKTEYNVTLLHGYFPVNLLHICRMTFTKNIPGILFLFIVECVINGIQIKHAYMK